MDTKCLLAPKYVLCAYVSPFHVLTCPPYSLRQFLTFAIEHASRQSYNSHVHHSRIHALSSPSTPPTFYLQLGGQGGHVRYRFVSSRSSKRRDVPQLDSKEARVLSVCCWCRLRLAGQGNEGRLKDTFRQSKACA